MPPHADAAHWAYLEQNAHLSDTQEQIRREIRAGSIRVVPAMGERIRIIPVTGEVQGTDEARSWRDTG